MVDKLLVDVLIELTIRSLNYGRVTPYKPTFLCSTELKPQGGLPCELLEVEVKLACFSVCAWACTRCGGVCRSAW